MFAFGCSYEKQLYDNLGVRARGVPTDDAFDHALGTGRVHAHAGCYADALSKGHGVLLLITEVLSGVHPDTASFLHRLSTDAAAHPGIDTTVYGSARGATRSHYTHHLRLISLAIALGVADQITEWAGRRVTGALDAAGDAALVGSLPDPP